MLSARGCACLRFSMGEVRDIACMLRSIKDWSASGSDGSLEPGGSRKLRSLSAYVEGLTTKED